MNTLPFTQLSGTWRGPGWQWLPAVTRSLPYWRTVARFALWGPLVGGLPYAVFIITIPFIYVLGFVPAALAGMLFAAWLHTPARRFPSAAWRAAVGALCGALACVAVAWAWATWTREPAGAVAWLFLAVHGVPAALAMALLQRQTVLAAPT